MEEILGLMQVLGKEIEDFEKEASEKTSEKLKLARKISDTEVSVSYEVSSAKAPDGKVLYSNEKVRDGESQRRLKLDDGYNSAVALLEGLESDIRLLQCSISAKKRLFRIYELSVMSLVGA